ncbi:MAG: hypothetical protein ACFFFT_20145 [Candidatus Thorarchaeota archaeon]
MSENLERTNKKTNEKTSKRSATLKSILLLINAIIILILVALFYQYGPNPIIIFFIFLLAIFTLVGPFLRRKKKSLYSSIFPDKKEARERQRSQKEFIRKRTEIITSKEEEITPNDIDLDIKFGKSLKSVIHKCSNCGMTLTSFMKKCPNCGKSVID